MSSAPSDSVAIIGLAIRAPGAADATEFFLNLCAGVDSISRFTREQQVARGVPSEILNDSRYVAAGGVLDEIDLFDASLFGMSRREAELADPQQRIFLEVVWKALEDAGVNPFAPDLVAGLFAGCSLSRYLMLHAAPYLDAIGSVANLLALTGNDKDHIATRTAYLLDLRGPCVNVQSSCSTSLVATHLACQSLLAQECDVAIAGAASIQLPQGFGYFHEPGGITSPDGFCRPFDALASGTVFGSGAGAVVLRRTDDALADGDRIYALIRGSAIYNDGGKKVGYTAPAHDGQVRTVATALAASGVEPASISYVECHGTGTALGDPVEIAALREAFGPDLREDSCWIGSVKGNIGHLECASGIAGLIKTALALFNETLPPSLHFSRPNASISFAHGPFQVVKAQSLWRRNGSARRAGVHSLGMGGTNAHLVLEEAPPAVTLSKGDESVLYLSARGIGALRDLAASYERFLIQQQTDSWFSICGASRARAPRLSERLAVVASSCGEAAGLLRQWRERDLVPGQYLGSPRSAAEAKKVSQMVRGEDHSETPVPHVALPAYPLRRERYWLDPLPAAAEPRPRKDHVLLGERHLNPKNTSIVFESKLSKHDPSWARHHVVNGVSTLPAAAFIEMALAAARHHKPHAHWNVLNAEFLKRLFLDDDDLTVQNHIEPRSDDAASWEVFSFSGTEWHLHARGRLSPADEPKNEPMIPFPDLNETGEALYSRAAQAGVDYSGVFRAIRSLRVDGRRSWAFVSLPPETSVKEYGIHPALLDACWQCAGALLPEGTDLWVPAAVDRISIFREGWRQAHCQAELFSSDGNWTADVRGWTEDGALAVETKGLCFRPLGSAPRRPEWIYESLWEEQPAALVDIAKSLTRRAGDLGKELDLSSLENLVESTEHATALFTWRAFKDLGVNLAPGARLSVRTICEQHGVLRRYERLVQRLLMLLERRGWIQCTEECTYTVTSPPDQDPTFYSRREAGRYPTVTAQWNLLTRCGESLPDVLRGEHEPLQLLFGQDGAAADIYESSPVSRLLNTLLAEAVQACTAAGGVSRVLEIGAGTGASTRAILPLLNPSVTYCFTDISPMLVEAARSAIPGLRYAVLDISKDPITQGLEAGEFDLVIASHVLHAIPNLRQTLGNIRRLIRPGGRLLLLETVEPQAWLDITFGLTPGWWNSADEDLRGGYPLLGLDAWTSLLGEQFLPAVVAGFEGTALLLAEVPRATASWCLLGNMSDTTALARELGRTGEPVQIAEDVHELGVLPREAALVDLRPLRLCDERVPERVRTLCHRSLKLAQKIAVEASAPTRYFFTLTRCAHSIDGGEQEPDAAAAALWGMSQTIRQELASVRSICIDLPTSISWSDVAAELRESLRTQGAESRIGLRGGRRFVQRVKPTKPVKIQSNWALAHSEGGLDSLRLVQREPRTPGEGEVEIQVVAAGLNFRDVLCVSGGYPSAPGSLGGECSGTVSAVGPGVTGLAIGDRVVAAAEGSLADRVMAKALLTAVKPTNLSWETTAGIPIAWMTAVFALEEIAQLSSGKTILIHAATGGVGLAATEIARATGAHILATAGSEEKRTFLRQRGINAVFDSRSDCFRDGVLAATQGKGVDVVLNCLGGELISAGFDVLAPGGHFLEIGRIGIWSEERARAYRPDVRYEAIALDELMRTEPHRAAFLLQHLLKRISDGELHPPPVHVFSPAEASTAFQLMRQARHIGKIIFRVPASRFAASPDATYLITGGTRGLGLRTAQWLTERGARNLVLASRHTDGDPKLEQALLEMAARGARIELRAVDTGDSHTVSDLIRWIDRELPPLAGVVHSAGVLLDHALVAFPWPDFERVLQTKIEAAWELHHQLEKRSLDFFVCYSSAGSLLGSAGQANHAAANAFLDSLCQFRRAAGKPALAVNWGAWSEIGSASSPQLAARLTSQGISRIDPDAGLAALDALLCGGPSQALVLPADWTAYFALEPDPPRILEQLRRPAESSPAEVKSPAKTSPNLREQLGSLAERERGRRLVDFVRTQAAAILGTPHRLPAPDEPLGDSGLDSLMAIELRGRLGAATGLTLPVTLLFDYPTAEALASYLFSEMGFEISPAEPTHLDPDCEEQRIAALLRQELREIETI